MFDLPDNTGSLFIRVNSHNSQSNTLALFDFGDFDSACSFLFAVPGSLVFMRKKQTPTNDIATATNIGVTI
jgi:hypothetical protein